MNVELGLADDLISVVEFVGLGRVSDVARMDHKGGTRLDCLYLADGFAECAKRVGVGGLVEANMAVADLQEGKKTVLIWYAYNHASPNQKKTMKTIFSKNKITHKDLLTMRSIIEDTGSLAYAKKEVTRLLNQAETIISKSRISKKYKQFLYTYPRQLLKL